MRIRLEKRLTQSRLMLVATPVASVLLTMLLGAIIFELIGFDGTFDGFNLCLTDVADYQDAAVVPAQRQVGEEPADAGDGLPPAFPARVRTDHAGRTATSRARGRMPRRR